jgi:hypothetical protein
MFDRQSLHRRSLATRTSHTSWTSGAAASVAAAFGLLALVPGALQAQEGHHDHGRQAGEHAHGDGHHGGLHFTHPLFAESVSPDQKVRLNYGYFDLAGENEQEHSASVGFEYAFSRAFSVEAAVPYSFTDGAAGITSVTLKFANYALEEQGLLLGYGIGAGLPTSGDAGGEGGHDHDHDHGAGAPAGIPDPAFDGGGGSVHATLGRDHWELSPFFNIGYRGGSWELVGFGTFGVPTGDVPADDGGVSISYNASALYHAGTRFDLLAEIHGSGGVQGHPVGEDVVELAPGIRWQVLPDRPLVLGAGASFPLTDRQNYDGRLLVSLFYHFGG